MPASFCKVRPEPSGQHRQWYSVSESLVPSTRGIKLTAADILADFSSFLLLCTADGDARQAMIRTCHSQADQFLAWCKEQGVNPATTTQEDVVPRREYLVDAGCTRASMIDGWAWRCGCRARKTASVRNLHPTAFPQVESGLPCSPLQQCSLSSLRVPHSASLSQRVQWNPLPKLAYSLHFTMPELNLRSV